VSAIDPFLEEVKGTQIEQHEFVRQGSLLPFCSPILTVRPVLKRFLNEQLGRLRSIVTDPTLPQGMLHGDIFPDNGKDQQM